MAVLMAGLLALAGADLVVNGDGATTYISVAALGASTAVVCYQDLGNSGSICGTCQEGDASDGGVPLVNKSTAQTLATAAPPPLTRPPAPPTAAMASSES